VVSSVFRAARRAAATGTARGGRENEPAGRKIKSVLGNKLEDKTPAIVEKHSPVIYGARAVGRGAGFDVRRCSRNGCRWPASASLTFAYRQRTVWIEDLTLQPHPAAYDLCAAHAERLAVPIGWIKEDLRVAPPPVTPIRPDVESWRSAEDASASGA
jgi:hypothetical protein